MDDTIDSSYGVRGESGCGDEGPRRWLLLTHHIPPEPAYTRVKVRRRLARIGAVALKSSVYALPVSDDALEDLQWLHREIEREGGEATLSEATFLDGATDARLLARFREERDGDYRALAEDAHGLAREAAGLACDGEAAAPPALARKLRVLTRKMEEVKAVDFFGADARVQAEQAVADARRAVEGEGPSPAGGGPHPDEVGTGRIWVTRRGVKVDRIASAWLIRRFVDGRARFRFVAPQGYEAAEEELRFDMFEGEFTHVGDACTFETLLAHFQLRDPALEVLARIVHDIDCKDDKFGREETAGVASLIDGIVRTHDDDLARLEAGGLILDGLYEHFRTAGR